jgi:uncharacterized protein (TIGR02246 family)
MNTEERAIRSLHSIWINAVNAGDLARLLTLMTDDAVFLGPGQEPYGRESFCANFTAATERLIVRCSSELEEVVVVGEVAYARSRDALAVTVRSGGAITQLAGHRITIYRRQPDNRWLLARDAHTVSQSN